MKINCDNYGALIPENSKFCNGCGTKQLKINSTGSLNQQPVQNVDASPDVPPTTPPPKKSGISKKWIIIGIFVVIMAVGALYNPSEDTNGSSTQTPIQTKWVTLQTYERTEKVLIIINSPLDVFTLPSETREWKVVGSWAEGDKDCTFYFSVFKWGEVEDKKIGSFSNRGPLGIGTAKKMGSEEISFTQEKYLTGKYYVNLASIAGVTFKIEVMAKVPE